MAKPYPPEIKASARRLFLRGFTMREIRDELRLAGTRQIYQWRKAGRWDEIAPANGMKQALLRRIDLLAGRDGKTKAETAEMDMLLKRIEPLSISLAKAGRIERGEPDPAPGGEAGTGGEKRTKRERKGGKKAPRNDVSGITPEMLAEVREKVFFRYAYQKLWWEVKHTPAGKNRFILKSRQIGATYYFAWEAFEDAVLTGDNQLFLSASRDQAEQFKSYILDFARGFFDLELKGDRYIKLGNGAEIRFVSTNASTAASYHGHLYIDEVFWIGNFKKVWAQASGMASHKKWRTTVFSVPSSKIHAAFDKWSGAEYNRGKPKEKHFSLDIDYDELHKLLAGGWLGPDRWWRHIVDIHDAEAAGCDLFDIEDLRARNSDEDFLNKYGCRFIDDARSAFSLALLVACGVDPATWKDFKKGTARPLGNKPVAIGYDPSLTGDNASVVVMAVPLTQADKWRVLERLDMRRVSHQYQANRIKELLTRYNVVHIGIDASGEGRGVWPYLEHLPQAVPYRASLAFKCDLVTKALDVVQPPHRLEFDAEDKDITAAFLMIHKTLTPGTSQVTYQSARNGAQGHADVAWAMMHAMIYEPINADGHRTTVTFSN